MTGFLITVWLETIGRQTDRFYWFDCELYQKIVIFNKLLIYMNYLEFEKALKSFPVFFLKIGRKMEGDKSFFIIEKFIVDTSSIVVIYP